MKKARNILLVEDHEPMRLAVAELIEADDLLGVMAAVETAEEALEVLGSQRPDLAVVDLNLPGMHGLELVAELERRAPGVPVVVLSSHSSERFGPVALDAGARAYIEKIRTTTDLVKTVRDLLEMPSHQRRAPFPYPHVAHQSAAPEDPESSYVPGRPMDDGFDGLDDRRPTRPADDWLHTN
jgi:DNA-binding NarL/FixJ family response regulator